MTEATGVDATVVYTSGDRHGSVIVMANGQDDRKLSLVLEAANGQAATRVAIGFSFGYVETVVRDTLTAF